MTIHNYMQSRTSFSLNYLFFITPPTKTMCSPSWHYLIGRHELFPSHLPRSYVFFSHTLLVRFSFFFFCVHCQPQFVSVAIFSLLLLLFCLNFYKFNSLYFICERNLVFNCLFLSLQSP